MHDAWPVTLHWLGVCIMSLTVMDHSPCICAYVHGPQKSLQHIGLFELSVYLQLTSCLFSRLTFLYLYEHVGIIISLRTKLFGIFTVICKVTVSFTTIFFSRLFCLCQGVWVWLTCPPRSARCRSKGIMCTAVQHQVNIFGDGCIFLNIFEIAVSL